MSFTLVLSNLSCVKKSKCITMAIFACKAKIKLLRGKFELMEYDYTIVHKESSPNKNAVALSRMELKVNERINENPAICEYVENFHESVRNQNEN